jgi:polysaccharide pyruvyl transferase WcaK-like protein
MYTMISVTRQSHAMVSSRYHGIVTTMPGGVVSAGITMDERIRNLMIDRGTPELALEVDDPQLEQKLLPTLRRLFDEADSLRDGIEACVVDNLVRMGEMGMALVDHVQGHHPDFPFAEGLGADGDPWAHLPNLPPTVQAIVKRQKGRAA